MTPPASASASADPKWPGSSGASTPPEYARGPAAVPIQSVSPIASSALIGLAVTERRSSHVPDVNDERPAPVPTQSVSPIRANARTSSDTSAPAVLAFESERRSVTGAFDGVSSKRATPPDVPTHTLSPARRKVCTRSFGRPSNVVSVRRHPPAGVSRATPRPDNPIQRSPLGLAVTASVRLLGSPAGDASVLLTGPFGIATVTTPPAVAAARVPCHAVRP